MDEQTYNYDKPYISREEYLYEKGVDLSIELKDDDNHSNKVDRFIKDITNFVMDYLLSEYATNELNRLISNFSELAEWRRKRFHFGMMEEIEYILNNGLIQLSAGINPETGAITDYSHLVIGSSAMREFKLGAFANVKTVQSDATIGEQE